MKTRSRTRIWSTKNRIKISIRRGAERRRSIGVGSIKRRWLDKLPRMGILVGPRNGGWGDSISRPSSFLHATAALGRPSQGKLGKNKNISPYVSLKKRRRRSGGGGSEKAREEVLRGPSSLIVCDNGLAVIKSKFDVHRLWSKRENLATGG